MRRLYAHLPNGKVNPEWDVINTWQMVYCAAKNPQCHFDFRLEDPERPAYQKNLEFVEKTLAYHVEYNAYTHPGPTKAT